MGASIYPCPFSLCYAAGSWMVLPFFSDLSRSICLFYIGGDWSLKSRFSFFSGDDVQASGWCGTRSSGARAALRAAGRRRCGWLAVRWRRGRQRPGWGDGNKRGGATGDPEPPPPPWTSSLGISEPSPSTAADVPRARLELLPHRHLELPRGRSELFRPHQSRRHGFRPMEA